MRNAQVVESWIGGKKAKSGNGRLHTDGSKLFSYDLCIGERQSDKIVIYNYRGEPRGKCQVTLTTDRHVGIALKHGGDTVTLEEPPEGNSEVTMWERASQRKDNAEKAPPEISEHAE